MSFGVWNLNRAINIRIRGPLLETLRIWPILAVCVGCVFWNVLVVFWAVVNRRKDKAMDRVFKSSFSFLVFSILLFMVFVSPLRADVPEEWQSLDVSGLTALSRQFLAKGVSGVDDCKSLAAYVSDRYSAASSSGDVDWSQWLDLASCLGSYYSEQTRASMCEGIKQSFASSDEVVAGLGFTSMINVSGVLDRLGDETSADSICSLWTTCSNKYEFLTPSQLSSLSRQLVSAGDSGDSARNRLAAYVTANYLSSPVTVRLVSYGDWRTLATSLSGNLSDESKSSWVEKISSAFSASDLSLGEVVGLASGLRSLDESSGAEFVASWMTTSEGWKSEKGRELTALASRLRGEGDAISAARKSLAEYLAGKYLADAESTRSLSCSEWNSLISSLGGDLSDESKSSWVSQLKSSFSGSEMGLKDVLSLSYTLRKLDDSKTGEFVASWMSASEGWKSEKGRELTALASRLRGEGDAISAARKSLAEYLAGKYLADAESTRSLSCSEWNSLISSLGGDLSDESKSSWVSQLKSSFSGSEMGLKDVLSLSYTLRKLDDSKTGEFVASWMSGSESWKDGEASELSSLAVRLRGCDDEAAKAARLSLLDHITAKYVCSTEAARSVSCSIWRNFIYGLLGDFTDELKSSWVSRLRSSFGVGELNTKDVLNLSSTLYQLGDQEVASFMAPWVSASADWKSCTAARLSSLAWYLRNGGDDSVESARKSLATHVLSEYLTDSAKIRSISCSVWVGLSYYLSSALSEEDRQLWGDKLCTAFIDSEVLAGLTSREVNRLIQSLRLLDNSQAVRLVSAWFRDCEDWVNSPVADLLSVGLWSAMNNVGDKSKIIGDLDDALSGRLGELSWRHYLYMGNIWLAVPDKAKAQQWVMRGYELAFGTEESRASIDSNSLKFLGQYLDNVELTGEGKAYPAFAAVLAELAKKDELSPDKWWRYGYYAAPLGTPEMRNVLRAELTDANGAPRAAVAKVLAMAYRESGELKSWQGFLDERISSTSGDTKALWLLARSFAESIVPHEVSPLRGKQWLDQALASAESVGVRFEALSEIVNGYADIGKHDTGLQLLDSMSGQFSGTAGAEDVEALKESIKKAKIEYVAASKRYVEEMLAERERLTEAELQRRLDAAIKDDDEEAIRRYEQLLGIEK